MSELNGSNATVKPNGERGITASCNVGSKQSKNEGSLIDTALYNLAIAQQYIDETKYLVEHRLISFHHAMSLLAKYRNDYPNLRIARQYLFDVVNWPPNILEDRNSTRLIVEARYNLGVIEDLLGDYSAARDHYVTARDMTRRNILQNYAGVFLLSHFGALAAGINFSQKTQWKEDNQNLEDVELFAQLSKERDELLIMVSNAGRNDSVLQTQFTPTRIKTRLDDLWSQFLMWRVEQQKKVSLNRLHAEKGKPIKLESLGLTAG